MADRAPRVVALTAGDIVRDPKVRTKLKPFYDALARRFPVAGIHDASLHGFSRVLNALRMIHPNRRYWRQRFHMNVPGFRARSRRAAAYLRSMRGRADVVLQDGVLFDARGPGVAMPSVVYTDYTARLAARVPAGGRSPFTPKEWEEWTRLECASMRGAEHVCTWSRFVRESVIADYGIAPERVTAIGGGVNLEPLPEAVQRSENGEPTALFIGSEFHRKGGDLLLRAFALVRSRLPNARLLLMTRGPVPGDLPLDGVETISATWNRDAVLALYRRSDLLVLPSRLETWGDVLLEAMAFGLPCIGVSGQAMEEIIEHEVTGLVLPPEDVEALAAGVARLMGDQPLRHRWGAAGRRRVETQFTWDRVVDRIAPALLAAGAQGPTP